MARDLASSSNQAASLLAERAFLEELIVFISKVYNTLCLKNSLVYYVLSYEKQITFHSYHTCVKILCCQRIRNDQKLLATNYDLPEVTRAQDNKDSRLYC